MRIAILTFDGFNELDSFIALGLLNRLGAQGWKAEIASPTSHVTSMNGVTVQAQRPLEFEPGSKWSYCNAGIDTLGRLQHSSDHLLLDLGDGGHG